MVMIVCKLGWAGQSKAGRGWLAGPLSKAERRWLFGQSWARLAGWAELADGTKDTTKRNAVPIVTPPIVAPLSFVALQTKLPKRPLTDPRPLHTREPRPCLSQSVTTQVCQRSLASRTSRTTRFTHEESEHRIAIQ